MRHYLFLDDAGEVVGVWSADTDIAAAQLSVQLALMYPDCTMIRDRAHDFEAFKAGYMEYDFDGLEPGDLPLPLPA